MNTGPEKTPTVGFPSQSAEHRLHLFTFFLFLLVYPLSVRAQLQLHPHIIMMMIKWIPEQLNFPGGETNPDPVPVSPVAKLIQNPVPRFFSSIFPFHLHPPRLHLVLNPPSSEPGFVIPPGLLPSRFCATTNPISFCPFFLWGGWGWGRGGAGELFRFWGDGSGVQGVGRGLETPHLPLPLKKFQIDFRLSKILVQSQSRAREPGAGGVRQPPGFGPMPGVGEKTSAHLKKTGGAAFNPHPSARVLSFIFSCVYVASSLAGAHIIPLCPTSPINGIRRSHDAGRERWTWTRRWFGSADSGDGGQGLRCDELEGRNGDEDGGKGMEGRGEREGRAEEGGTTVPFPPPFFFFQIHQKKITLHPHKAREEGVWVELCR